MLSLPKRMVTTYRYGFDDGLSGREIEDIVAAIEADACQRWPLVRRLYIRPQRGAGQEEPLPDDVDGVATVQLRDPQTGAVIKA